MEIKHFSHKHPLVFREERGHQSKMVDCSGCGELVSGPNFSCVQCEFYLDKLCAEAPTQMNHPFHPKHSFNLLKKHPYRGECPCDFCKKKCKKFVYHCDFCDLDLHIKCAFFSNNIAQKRVDYPQNIPSERLSIISENLKKEKCFACWTPLVDSRYFSSDWGFSLHKKCIELPLENNDISHHQHSLFLQFNMGRLPCQHCQKTNRRGLVYCCSICKFVLHIRCMLPSPIIQNHQHPFTRLLLRQSSFTCDACGTIGKSVSYICSTCNLIVHKKCISLPRFIKHMWHHHPLFHNYSLVHSEFGTMECGVCHKEVNKECGSYYCSLCSFVLHVNCALQVTWRYYEIATIEYYRKLLVVDSGDPPFYVVHRDTKYGEDIEINTEINHFSHDQHNLVLNETVKDDDRYCDCCSLLITTSFYLCLQCHFSLHKSCAELPRKKQVMVHNHQVPHDLIPNSYFCCQSCNVTCSGFAYKCMECGDLFCVRCAGISSAFESQGHKHLLYFFIKNGWQCNACGQIVDDDDNNISYSCKGCDFNVHPTCALKPQTARHKCDEHLLTLKYQEDNDYSKNHYCDICEEDRNPNHWFYHCAICDTSAHPKCVLGDFPFIKLGATILYAEHPHHVMVVRKVYDYPECCKNCGKQCSDVKALECLETGCNYIIHLGKCV